MNILKKINNFIYTKSEIIHSEITTVFTKYGRFQMKAYKDDTQEYIAIMSPNFFKLKQQIVYVHSESHHCDTVNESSCYCGNQMEIALKMLQRSGGVVLYGSSEGQEIDLLLRSINTRNLNNAGGKKNSKVKFDVKDNIRYPSLAFIFNDLKVSTIKLITNNEKIVDTVEALGIEILQREEGISFEYGNQKVAS